MPGKKEIPPEISSYYELGLERGRLFSRGGELERRRTQEIISRYLPRRSGIALDVGGGPGYYAFWLSAMGLQVYLVDPIPIHLSQAMETALDHPGKQPAGIYLGDARSLDIPSNFADYLLLLGPLYHLTERVDRQLALEEAIRVLKPGGRLFAVGISRFASTLAGMIQGYFSDPDFISIARRDVHDGQHRNPKNEPDYFTTAYFHHPDELSEEVQSAGFALQDLLAVEGPGIFLQDLDAKWRDTALQQAVMEGISWMESDPAVLGATGHIMAVAEKPA